MTPLVLDSSALVALLADGGDHGEWVATAAQGRFLAAPELALFEAANILRRMHLAGELTGAEASLAHADLLTLPLQLWPYVALAERAWALQQNLTVYDASYVALAELLDAPLATLDERLSRSTGPSCSILTPADRNARS